MKNLLFITFALAIYLGSDMISVAANTDKTKENQVLLTHRLVTLIASRSQGGNQLLAVTRDEGRGSSQKRFLEEIVPGQNGSMLVRNEKPLDGRYVAFAHCPRRHGQERLLAVHAHGVQDFLTGANVIETPTLFAHRSHDTFPEVPICFDLFGDAEPALVVPVLSGVRIFRWSEEDKTYRHDVDIDVDGQSRFFWQSNRESAPGVQHQNASVNLDFPDHFLGDFNGDGKSDLCFAYGERVECLLQMGEAAKRTFKGASKLRFNFDMLSEAEKDDTSVRLRNLLLDINRDGLPDLVLQKTIWNLSGMETTLYFYKNKQGTGYKGAPDQVVKRSGYFAYHDYVDLNGDGFPELVAPVADMSFTDLFRILVSRSVSIDIISFKNSGGTFAAKPETVFSHDYPVNFRNAASLAAVLPIWNVRPRLSNELAAARGLSTYALFFPKKEEVALLRFPQDRPNDPEKMWSKAAELGDSMFVADLDGDGIDELYNGWPRDSTKAKRIVRIPL